VKAVYYRNQSPILLHSNESVVDLRKFSSLPNKQMVGYSSSTDEALMAETCVLHKSTCHQAPIKQVVHR